MLNVPFDPTLGRHPTHLMQTACVGDCGVPKNSKTTTIVLFSDCFIVKTYKWCKNILRTRMILDKNEKMSIMIMLITYDISECINLFFAVMLYIIYCNHGGSIKSMNYGYTL